LWNVLGGKKIPVGPLPIVKKLGKIYRLEVEILGEKGWGWTTRKSAVVKGVCPEASSTLVTIHVVAVAESSNNLSPFPGDYSCQKRRLQSPKTVTIVVSVDEA